MRLITTLSVLLTTFSTTTCAVSLIDALNANGATNFAQTLQSNPDILSLYNSPNVQTVFAPVDASSGKRSLLPRQAPNQAGLEYQCSKGLTNLETMQIFPGTVSNTNLPSSQLGGQSQAVVAQSGVNTNSTSSSKLRRQAGGNVTIPAIPVSLVSGLGSKASVLKGDIAYDGGLIHIVENFFTLPESLSNTISSTGLSSFQGVLQQANLSSSFNSQSSVTIFTPSNAAFAAANISQSPASLQSLLNNHVIPNFVGYLPSLQNGATYNTLGGQSLTITVKNGAYFVNGAQIISANTIIQNGVVHVVNKVLTPSPPLFTGDGWSLKQANTVAVAMAAALFVLLAV